MLCLHTAPVPGFLACKLIPCLWGCLGGRELSGKHGKTGAELAVIQVSSGHTSQGLQAGSRRAAHGTMEASWLVHFPLLLFLLAWAPVTDGQAINAQAQQKLCADDAFPLDCEDVYDQGSETDGVYLIYPSGPNIPVPVYCDMTTDDGKWTVFQKRFNGSVSFFRGWNDYRFGFGRADSEYWLGLQNIHLLTLKRKYELRVDLEDFENNTAWAKYADFSLSPHAISAEEDGYTLHVGGFTDGGAGDSLSYHTGQKFSTFDRDQDLYVQNCAALSSGAWWFKSCHFSNLNGFYLGGAHLSYANGLNWAQWKGFYYSLRKSEMKIRRI
ncbi:microfibril-associated glycoprotein 4 [Pangshura tecta]